MTKGCQCVSEADNQQLLIELDKMLDEYNEREGGLIPALQIAQGIFGYLPENVLKIIGKAFNKSYSEVAGVVSFYSFFSTQPRGKHVIRVCLGTACYVRGGKQVLEALKKELAIEVGDTTPDRKFSLEVARCFGACGLAPAIMIDEDVHQRVKPQKIKQVLAPYIVQEAEGEEA